MLDTVSFNTVATEGRFRELREYCEQEAHIDPSDFHCDSVKDCEGDVGKTGLNLVSGGLAHVGEDYDVRVLSRSIAACSRGRFGRELRIMFVGYDYGNDCAGLVQRRHDIQTLKPPLNPHYSGVLKVLIEMFQSPCQRIEDEHLWRPLLRRMAQTNATRCCAPGAGETMKCNTTTEMRGLCWIHFRKEIGILRPTIIFFHGKALKESFLANLPAEGLAVELSVGKFSEHYQHITWNGKSFSEQFQSVLLFFNHPAYRWFGNEWDDQVNPVLEKLREDRLLPTLDEGWTPRLRDDWPKI